MSFHEFAPSQVFQRVQLIELHYPKTRELSSIIVTLKSYCLSKVSKRSKVQQQPLPRLPVLEDQNAPELSAIGDVESHTLPAAGTDGRASSSETT